MKALGTRPHPHKPAVGHACHLSQHLENGSRRIRSSRSLSVTYYVRGQPWLHSKTRKIIKQRKPGTSKNKPLKGIVIESLNTVAQACLQTSGFKCSNDPTSASAGAVTTGANHYKQLCLQTKGFIMHHHMYRVRCGGKGL